MFLHVRIRCAMLRSSPSLRFLTSDAAPLGCSALHLWSWSEWLRWWWRWSTYCISPMCLWNHKNRLKPSKKQGQIIEAQENLWKATYNKPKTRKYQPTILHCHHDLRRILKVSKVFLWQFILNFTNSPFLCFISFT